MQSVRWTAAFLVKAETVADGDGVKPPVTNASAF
jgi:hypothetical protein